MKIHPSLQQKFQKFCLEHSRDIEYDSVIRYANKVSMYLDEKIDTKSAEPAGTIIKNNIKDALTFCDTKGVTSDQQRSALEILSRYWLHGKHLKEIKTSI